MIETYFSYTKIQILFPLVNGELEKMEQWFKANKLSLNI